LAENQLSLGPDLMLVLLVLAAVLLILVALPAIFLVRPF